MNSHILKEKRRTDHGQTWAIRSNSNDPAWYWDCSSCSTGMAAVINPPPLDPIKTPNKDTDHSNDVLDTYVPPLELWRDKHDILFIVSLEEWMMCLPGQKGGRLGKRKVEELWRPRGENDSRTVEDEEASKAPWTPGSNAARKLSAYGRWMVVAAVIIGVILCG